VIHGYRYTYYVIGGWAQQWTFRNDTGEPYGARGVDNGPRRDDEHGDYVAVVGNDADARDNCYSRRSNVLRAYSYCCDISTPAYKTPVWRQKRGKNTDTSTERFYSVTRG